MMDQINKLMELIKALQEGTTSPQEIAAQVKQSLPPHLLAMAKNETAESLITKLEPLAASFLGPDVAALLKTEATTKILTQALVIIKTEDPS